MTKRVNRIILVLFSAFIAIFFLANLFIPDREFSPNENRYLQTLPSFSFRSLFSGRFTSDFESYCSDQFAARDWWISLKARLELAQGKGENNGVFLCEGERLIEPFSAPPAAEIRRRAEIVKTFAETANVPVTLALIPTASELYGDILPRGAENDSQAAVIDLVYSVFPGQTADLLASFREHAGEDLFYRTDHHWTSRGAFLAYQTLSEALGYVADDGSACMPEIVSEAFCGTAYSSSGFFWVTPDRMEILRPEPDGLTVERYDAGVPVPSSLYHREMLETKDKYRFFLGGNSPRIVLDTGKADLPSLLIIRDSYSDSFVPFLPEHFSRIHLLDLRYFRNSIQDYIREEGIDRVLVMYSVNNFCSDSNLMLMTQ
ncbi:MAG: hypothetical protein IJH47_00900 [Oscillospiraceae bacterium]|nr:hypothetical protein [Oscillospiraceae bacterium]